ncbi:hypothetical protein [Mycobacterium riyadhense]|uniref:hypothetical protein n=1 Tax=Mycobacterium riyadhense TaxID=486698 RepID=UPI00194E3C44|nr:hypothetical protein [Mycobacterium riyadhense]
MTGEPSSWAFWGPLFGGQTDKYVVMCGCDDERNPLIVAWIDDDRRGSGRIHVGANHHWSETSYRGHVGYQVGHRACGRNIELNQDNTGELIDAIHQWLTEVGPDRWTSVPHHADDSLIERRRVIPFDLLCRLNSERGKRRQTKTRR